MHADTAPLSTGSTATLEPRVKPRLRGVSHLLAFLAFAPAVLWLVGHARPGAARTGAAIYGASVALLFATSALYHCVFWSSRIRSILGRIDHSAIFLLIAGTFTPFGLVIGRPLVLAALTAMWLGALAWASASARRSTSGSAGSSCRSSRRSMRAWARPASRCSLAAGFSTPWAPSSMRCAARIPSRAPSVSTRSFISW